MMTRKVPSPGQDTAIVVMSVLPLISEEEDEDVESGDEDVTLRRSRRDRKYVLCYILRP